MRILFVLLMVIFPVFMTACSKHANTGITNQLSNTQHTEFSIRAFDNIPSASATALRQALQRKAPDYALQFSANTASIELKGYFSTESDDGVQLDVFYVVDVFNKKNQRIARLNGRLDTRMKSSDPWQNISFPQYEQLADNILTKLARQLKR